MATLPAFPGLVALPDSDKQALVGAAAQIGIDPAWLATIIQFESGGSFSPAQKNAAGSGATGLIQFMPSTAQGLGTSTEALAAMSFADQLGYVVKYFAPYAARIRSLDDAYLAVLYPAFIGSADDAVLGRAGSAIYEQNRGFDSTGKGFITKADITQTIRNVAASAPGTLEIGASSGGVAAAVPVLMATHPIGRVLGELALMAIVAGGVAYVAWTLSPDTAPWKSRLVTERDRVLARLRSALPPALSKEVAPA